ncbi:putative agmatine deiminase 1 [Penicillium rolfsii]|nr:putative agmatine deiminase 1 [Penicillium rolfsii]
MSTTKSLHTETNPNKRYTYLAETTPHLATILGFPSHCSTFPSLYERTCHEIVDLAGTIATFEPVRLHVRPEDQARAQRLVDERMATAPAEHRDRIRLIAAPTNHVWVRDTGPVYVRGEDDGKRYAIDFRFCEWGNKVGELLYNSSSDKTAAMKEVEEEESDWPIMDEEVRKENTAFAQRVLELENELYPESPVARVVSGVRLEGGGIELDGEGTFMAMESSVIVPSRNKGLSRQDIETELRRLLGIKKFIWIPGREGLDITDYHIDAEARFIRPGVVVVGRPHRKCDQVFWDVYNEMRAILDTATDAQGRKLQVHDIEEPDPDLVKGDVPGEEIAPAASYVNFYFTNGGLVIPKFGDEVTDAQALETLTKLVPERQVCQVAVNALPRTGGVLHCTTQQVL